MRHFVFALTALLSATSADRASILMFDPDGVMRFKAWRNLSDAYRTAVTGTFEIRTSRLITLRRNIDSIV